LATAGAAAALVVGYAGMMTEDLEPRMLSIPDVSDFPEMKSSFRNAIATRLTTKSDRRARKLVEVETREEMVAAINPKTVAIHFTNISPTKAK
jgi:L-seryl-tRNA(Ser) seleniumtransferase